jgi:hypothetical protein
MWPEAIPVCRVESATSNILDRRTEAGLATEDH